MGGWAKGGKQEAFVLVFGAFCRLTLTQLEAELDYCLVLLEDMGF